MLDLDPKTLSDWLQWLFMGALGLFSWLRRPGEAASAAVAQLGERLNRDHNELVNRVVTLEEQVRHMPTSADLAKLEGTVQSLAVDTSAIKESMQITRVQLNRIEAYLLQAKDSRL